MKTQRPKRDLVEIFGYAPDDMSTACRSLWTLGACPFTEAPCVKTNHDKTVVYGVCSVTTKYGDCVVCPNRLYADGKAVLKRVAKDAFGSLPFYSYQEFVRRRDVAEPCVVALGINSGNEVRVPQLGSMDWVLARIEELKLTEYTGIEVQSVDVTGNYRDAWHAYRRLEEGDVVPSSEHGMNWANVYKRLIPQILRKSLVYSRSSLVKNGLNFIAPEIVYQRFEDVIGADIPQVKEKGPDVITVYTYSLGEIVSEGRIRKLEETRKIRFKFRDFAERVVSGPNLPTSEDLDGAVARALGVEKALTSGDNA